MLPHRPRALDQEFDPEIALNSAPAPAICQTVDHPSQVCPTCSHRLSGHRCKLVCAQCGYYMSCADYY